MVAMVVVVVFVVVVIVGVVLMGWGSVYKLPGVWAVRNGCPALCHAMYVFVSLSLSLGTILICRLHGLTLSHQGQATLQLTVSLSDTCVKNFSRSTFAGGRRGRKTFLSGLEPAHGGPE